MLLGILNFRSSLSSIIYALFNFKVLIMNIIKSLECCNNQSKTYLGLCVTTLYLVYKGSCCLLIPCYKNFLKVSFSFLLLIGQLFFPNNEMEVGLYRGGSKRDTLKGQVRISYRIGFLNKIGSKRDKPHPSIVS